MPEKLETMTLTFERETWDRLVDILESVSTDLEFKSLTAKRESEALEEKANLCYDLANLINDKLGE